MQWVRKLSGSVLAFILLLSLVVGAGSFSIKRALAQPNHLETWTSQSNIYQNFVQTITNQAETALGSGEQGDLSSSVVAQAAQSAFPVAQLRQDVTTVINSNYDWLKGHTAIPNFNIDLTASKQAFAEQIGAYVQTRLLSLPVCSVAELQKMQSFDPLSSACRPQNLSPSTVSAEISQQISVSSRYISRPALTADNINPYAAQPYYKMLSKAPTAYKIGTELPVILGTLATVTAGLLVIVLPGWRRGVRRIAFTLVLAGVILLFTSFLDNSVVSAVQQQLFKQYATGSIQESLVDIVRRTALYITHLDILVAVGFLVLAIVLYVIILLTRQKTVIEGGGEAQKLSLTPIPTPDYEPEPVPEIGIVPAQVAKVPPKKPSKLKQAPTDPMSVVMDVRRPKTNVPARIAVPLPAKKQVQPRRPKLVQ